MGYHGCYPARKRGFFMSMKENLQPQVIKFGGVKMQNAESIHASADHVVQMTHERPTVAVVSAAKGVTDLLHDDILTPYRNGRDHHARNGVNEFYSHQRGIISSLEIPQNEKVKLELELERMYDDLTMMIGFDKYQEFISGYILSLGEHISARIFERAVNHTDTKRTVNARHIRSHDLIRTNDSHENAVPDLEASQTLIQRQMDRAFSQGVTPVVDGFAGANQRGEITVMKRNASDMTGAIIARAIQAETLFLAKGVSGVYDKNPHEFDDAVHLPTLNRNRATELSNSGGKVLCEGVVEILDPQIEIVVFDPSQPEIRSVISDNFPNPNSPTFTATAAM